MKKDKPKILEKYMLSYLLEKSRNSKQQIVSMYNEVLKFTNVSYKITDENHKNESYRTVTTLIARELNDLNSFLISSIFNRTSKWAVLKMNEKLLRLVGQEGDEYSLTQAVQKYNKQLEDASDTVYMYLNQSNYFSEISRAAKECINLGVGAYRISETLSMTNPFTFRYLPIDDLFFSEDSQGNPCYIFRYLRDMNEAGLRLMYQDANIKIPPRIKRDTKDGRNEFDFLEIVYPDDSDLTNRKYVYELRTTDLEHVLMRKVLSYSPIVIFRWSKEGNSPNGIGLSLLGLGLFRDLAKKKRQRDISAEKILAPAIAVRGSRKLATDLSLKAGAVNYVGTGQELTHSKDLIGDLKVQTIAPIPNILPLDQDIDNLTHQIKELYLSRAVGATADYKRRSATETVTRLEALRQKWGLSFEMIERELLTPTFMAAFKILIEKRQIEFDTEKLDTTMVIYRNALAASQEIQDVENLGAYMQTGQQILPAAQNLGVDSMKALLWLQEKFNLSSSILMSEDEMQEFLSQEEAMVMDTMTPDQQEAMVLRQQEAETDAARVGVSQRRQAIKDMEAGLA